MMSTMMVTVKLMCFFACILRTSFASDPKSGYASVQQLATDVQEAVARILTDFEPAGPNRTKANQWVVVVAQQASGEQLEYAAIAKVASINDLALTAELVSLADGFHLIVPREDAQEVENEQRITAVAVVNMLMDLKTMERVDTILANCSLRSTLDLLFNKTGPPIPMHEKEVSNEGGARIEQLFNHWLQSIAVVLRNDPRVSEEFAKRRNEAEIELNGGDLPTEPLRADVSAAEEKLAKMMASSQLFRRAALNRIFLRHASKHVELIDTDSDRKHFFLARALLELAGHRGRDVKLNRLYQDALVQVAGNMSDSDLMEEMRDKLFAHLKKAIEGDVELSESIKAVENKLGVWIAFRGLRRSLAMI